MPPKQKINAELQALELLKNALPKAVSDLKLVEKIYHACEKEITSKAKVVAFEKFCAKTELPDLKKETVAEVKRQFEESFGKGTVSVVTHPEKEAATIEVVTPHESFEGVIKVGAVPPPEEGVDEFKPKFVAFPVSLEGDPDLAWILGRGETTTAEEGAILLAKVEEDFWASKAGQKMIREGVERSFPEFILRVPSKMLGEVGLKRHYKDPEPLKRLRPIEAKK